MFLYCNCLPKIAAADITHRMQRWFVLLLLSIGLIGCSTPTKMTDILSNSSLFYQPTIIQGDLITRSVLRKLKPGLTRQQVRALLGSPILQDSFHATRWDYVYTEGQGSQPIVKRYLAVYFEDDLLTHIEGTMGTAETAQSEAPKPQVVRVPDWQG